MRKTILMILNQSFPDIRVKQEYDALVSQGYRVIVITRTNQTELDNSYELLPVAVSLGEVEAYANCFFRGNPWLVKRIIKELELIGVVNLDAVHVHDLFWGVTGYRLSKIFNAKLIMDFHENYPAMLQHFNESSKKHGPKKSLRNKFFDDVLLGYERLKRYEKRMLSKCDGYIVVVDEALDRLRDINPLKKGVVVSNTKSPELIPFKSLSNIEPIKLVYVGTIQELRGLEVAVTAMQYLPSSDYELTIVGFKNGCLVKKQLESIILAHNIKNVNLIGFLTDEKKLNEYIYNSHIGIIPHQDCELCQTTIPHKLFSYMAMGRPVLTSDVKPFKRLIYNKGVGDVFRAGSAKDFSEKIKAMSTHRLLIEYGRNARKLVETEYNWSKDKNRLLDLYNSLLTNT